MGRILASGTNITKLSLAQSSKQKCQLTHRTGEYIGQAILDNPSCGLTKLDLKGINLGESGL